MNLLADFSDPVLVPWQNFYVVIGSSAGALIGLQFVVIALLSGMRSRADVETIDAFGTPTVVHFGGALTIGVIMLAPWPAEFALCLALLLCGVHGVGYSVIVLRRALRQRGYKPVTEDWIWYVTLPSSFYVILAASALLLWSIPTVSLFAIAGATLLLLLVGIHNAWDTVTHLVSTAEQDDAAKGA